MSPPKHDVTRHWNTVRQAADWMHERTVGVHVDTTTVRSSPFPAELRGAAEALRVPPPEHASRRIALP